MFIFPLPPLSCTHHFAELASAAVATISKRHQGPPSKNNSTTGPTTTMQPRLQLTSAAGIISLLDDSLPEMKIFALERLNSVVDEFWAEISEVVPKIEILYEDESFPHRQLAALVASKVYYHLGSFEDSLTYALGAGSLFNVTATSEYVETIVSKSIDHYIKLRAAAASATNADKPPIDSRLEDIVNRMFQRCFEDGQFKQAIGIALETRRMDVFEQAILHSNDLQAMLAYAFKITMSLIDNLHFRDQVLKILVNLYRNLQVPDYINMVQCLIFLDDDKAIAEVSAFVYFCLLFANTNLPLLYSH